MEKNTEPQESLVIWCPEFYEAFPLQSCGWNRLLDTTLLRYLDATPSKPVFCALTNNRDTHRYSNEQSIIRIEDGEGAQNSHWQIETIRAELQKRGLKSVEIIGALPGCITMVGNELGRNGIKAVVSHIDKPSEVFEKQ